MFKVYGEVGSRPALSMSFPQCFTARATCVLLAVLVRLPYLVSAVLQCLQCLKAASADAFLIMCVLRAGTPCLVSAGGQGDAAVQQGGRN